MEQISTAKMNEAPKASKEDYVSKSINMLSEINNIDRLKRIYMFIRKLYISDLEEQSTDKQGKIESLYCQNETMRFLGNQIYLPFYGNNEVMQQIKDIKAAHSHFLTDDVAADIFMLGYIYGKQAERSRRKYC